MATTWDNLAQWSRTDVIICIHAGKIQESTAGLFVIVLLIQSGWPDQVKTCENNAAQCLTHSNAAATTMEMLRKLDEAWQPYHNTSWGQTTRKAPIRTAAKTGAVKASPA